MASSLRPLAVVTGASSGIGYELALCCVQHGYDLVIAADESEIHDAAVTFRGRGANVDAVEADLESRHPGRFTYNSSKGPDVLDRNTNVRVELTTERSYQSHLNRGGLYRRAPYVLYRGVGQLPIPPGGAPPRDAK